MSRLDGDVGESKAADFLIAKGWCVLDRNFYSKSGEIDIVARSDDGTLVFCEVKTYTNKSWVHPLAAITKKKQRNLVKTAQFYLLKNGISNEEMRFDALVVGEKDVDHIENVIQLSS